MEWTLKKHLQALQKSKIILFNKDWFWKKVAIATLVYCLFCSCATQKAPTDSEVAILRNTIVSLAKKELGDSYKYGSSGPHTYDCSGLVKYIFDQVNVPISGSSGTMSKKEGSTHFDKAQPGDLIFFAEKGKVFHVAIISASSNQKLTVIHSTSSKGVIQQEILSSSYWQPKMYKIISLEALLN